LAKFGDPLYAIKANFSGVNRYFVNNDAPWGDHNPWFYFDQMFHDGRDMWIVPYLAVRDCRCFCTSVETARASTDDGVRMFWHWRCLDILVFYLHAAPIKFIPKQQNYAVIFFAPLALLAGYGRGAAEGPLAAGVRLFSRSARCCCPAFGCNTISCTTLPSINPCSERKNIKRHGVVPNRLCIPRDCVPAEHHTALAQDLRSLDTLGVTDLSELAQSGKALLHNYRPGDAGLAAKSRAAPSKQNGKMLVDRDTFDAEANGVGQLVTDFFKWLRPKLPASSIVAFHLQMHSCIKRR